MSDKDVLTRQHERFRAVVERHVEHTLKYHGVEKDDWIVQCYRSVEDFETRFPNSQEREAMIDRLEAGFAANWAEMEAVRRGMPSLQPFMR